MAITTVVLPYNCDYVIRFVWCQAPLLRESFDYSIININISATDVYNGPRRVMPSTVSLAGVYESPAKPVLAGVHALQAPTGRWSRLNADIGRES